MEITKLKEQGRVIDEHYNRGIQEGKQIQKQSELSFLKGMLSLANVLSEDRDLIQEPINQRIKELEKNDNRI